MGLWHHRGENHMTAPPMRAISLARMSDYLKVGRSSILRLERRAPLVRKTKGTVLFSQGDTCRGVFLIKSGKVKLRAVSARGEQVSHIVGAGSMLGLTAAIGKRPFDVTAEVVCESTMVFVSTCDLLRDIAS